MAIYVGVLDMFAGEDKTISSSPADPTNPPNISGWTLEGTFAWTDGSGSFVKSASAFNISTPDWTLVLANADTVNGGGKRLKFNTRRVDVGYETELEWGFINVRVP